MKKLSILVLFVSAFFMSCTNESSNSEISSTSSTRTVAFFLTDGPDHHGKGHHGADSTLAFSAVNLDIVSIQYQLIDTTLVDSSYTKAGRHHGIYEDNHDRHHPEMASDTASWYDLDFSEQTITVSMLSNGDSTLLANLSLPEGYVIGKVKFKLGTSSTVILNDSAGTEMPLIISDSSDSTLIIHVYDPTPSGNYNVMLDFDIARSIYVDSDGNCYLRPVMRGFVMETTGEVVGSIVPDSISTKVFIITDSDTISTVSDVNRKNRFKIDGLDDGTYTVQFMPLDTIGEVTVTKSVTISSHNKVVLSQVDVIP